MKTDATQPTQLVQYWRDSDKEDNEISKKVSDENICNILSDISLTYWIFAKDKLVSLCWYYIELHNNNNMKIVHNLSSEGTCISTDHW